MLINKLLLFLALLFLFVSCTSKSAQAKLRNNDTLPSIEVNRVKDNLSFSVNPNEFFLYPSSTKSQIIKHPYFTVSYCEKDEQAEWVAYIITSNNYNKSIERTNDYREDPYVKTGSARPEDYSGSGYDMGIVYERITTQADGYSLIDQQFKTFRK